MKKRLKSRYFCFPALKGKGIFNDDGVETEVGEGDVMYTGPGHSHGLANAGDEDLVISALVIFDKENN